MLGQFPGISNVLSKSSVVPSCYVGQQSPANVRKWWTESQYKHRYTQWTTH